MRTSSFLTFIIFCFLLFLEGVTEAQKTFENLDLGFSTVSLSLKRLLFDIHERGVTANDSDEIDQKINWFIKEKVDKNFDSLKLKGKQGVRGGIRITSEADKIRHSLNLIVMSNENPTREALLERLGTIETIWDDEIQPHVNEALKDEEEQPQ